MVDYYVIRTGFLSRPLNDSRDFSFLLHPQWVLLGLNCVASFGWSLDDWLLQPILLIAGQFVVLTRFVNAVHFDDRDMFSRLQPVLCLFWNCPIMSVYFLSIFILHIFMAFPSSVVSLAFWLSDSFRSSTSSTLPNIDPDVLGRKHKSITLYRVTVLWRTGCYPIPISWIHGSRRKCYKIANFMVKGHVCVHPSPIFATTWWILMRMGSRILKILLIEYTGA